LGSVLAAAFGVGAVPVLALGPAPVAITAVAIVVVASGAGVAVDVVTWRGARWGRAGCSGLDVDVHYLKVLARTVSGLASVTPEPVVIGSPIRKGERHTVPQVVGHLVEIAALASQGNLVIVLADDGVILVEVVVAICKEFDLHMEIIACVDTELLAWTVGMVVLVFDFADAGATTITIGVPTMLIW